MPNVNDLGESKYLKKEDVDPPVVVTIESWEKVNVARDNDKAEMKYTLTFAELDKPLVLNKTNGNRIARITGEGEFDAWIGKKVELFNDEDVEFGGKLVGGIRVRKISGQLTPAQQQAHDNVPEDTRDYGNIDPSHDEIDDIPF